jgi:hypothetical protein
MLLLQEQRAFYPIFSFYQLLTSNRLLGVTVITAFCADYCKLILVESCYCLYVFFFSVVASIEETAIRYSIPKAFIGLILLPIVVCDISMDLGCNVNAVTGQCG